MEGIVLAEYDGGGNLVAGYIYANGQRMAKVLPNGDMHYYLNDHLGSARAMLGIGWSANYYPYGEIASQSGSSEDTHFDFTGHERDSGTGLLYAGARFYEPELGRWLSVDPLAVNPVSKALDQSLVIESPYIYVSDNPMKYLDPNGRYKLRTSTVKRYPMLMSAVLQTEEFALKSNRIQRIFNQKVGTPVKDFVGFGIIMKSTKNKEFIKGLGKGPEIIVSDFEENQAGRARTAMGHTEIEVARWLVDKLESNNPNVVAAAMELLKRTILHETAHRLNKRGYDVHGISGNKFEQEAFDEPPQPSHLKGNYWDYWFNVIWPKIRKQTEYENNQK